MREFTQRTVQIALKQFIQFSRYTRSSLNFYMFIFSKYW